MKKPYWVLHNGVMYEPNTEIPESGSVTAPQTNDNTAKTNPVTVEEEIHIPESKAVHEAVNKPEDKERYIGALKFMNEERLNNELKKYGIEVTEDLDKKALRALLIEKLFG